MGSPLCKDGDHADKDGDHVDDNLPDGQKGTIMSILGLWQGTCSSKQICLNPLQQSASALPPVSQVY